MRMILRIAGCALLGLPWAVSAAERPQGELRLRHEVAGASRQGPLALVEALQPGAADTGRERWALEAGLRWVGHQGPLALGIDALAAWQAQDGRLRGRGASRLNELHLGLDAGAWQLSLGRKVVSWDVGHGFRPNDMVQQEQRRTLDGARPQGRPLVLVEHFDAERALSLAWVNPRHRDDGPDRAADGREAALAARAYWRRGELDLHLFARRGERTGASLGGALAAVASDSLAVHASLRIAARHERWAPDAPASGPGDLSNPWWRRRHGRALQGLVGLAWTGSQQQSLIVEAWHDGSALPDSTWTAWNARNLALAAAASPRPADAQAGLLAWQASWQTAPLDAPTLRRDNLYLRLSWQPGAWTLAADRLVTPADRGHVSTLSAQWQGDRWRLTLAGRQLGGPSRAVLAQLPSRRRMLATAEWSW
jgi:hypothetical protein